LPLDQASAPSSRQVSASIQPFFLRDGLDFAGSVGRDHATVVAAGQNAFAVEPRNENGGVVLRRNASVPGFRQQDAAVGQRQNRRGAEETGADDAGAGLYRRNEIGEEDRLMAR